MTPQPTIHVLYFNGLGRGKTRKAELLAMSYLKKHGIDVVHAPIDWYAGESFTDLFTRMTALTQEHLKKHGELILVGSSAGGSLAVNILGELHSPNLGVITLCSRLRETTLPWWDKRDLAFAAHFGRRGSSQAFFDSVSYGNRTAIPKLTTAEKRRIITVRQWVDFAVPRPTMDIDGVKMYRVPAIGHVWGIAMAARRLPVTIKMIL